MAIKSNLKNLKPYENSVYEQNKQTNMLNANKGLDKYATAYSYMKDDPTKQVIQSGTLNTPKTTPIITPQTEVVSETSGSPLKNAYDSYKSTLDLNKLSSQNEIANATKVAQQYMDNYLKYYGMQGSGMGQSAYTNLATNQANQMAQVNRDYNTDLANYRQQLNSETLTEGKDFAANMNDEDWSNYLTQLQNDPTVDEKTLNTLSQYRDAYGVSSFETSLEDSKGTLQSAIDTAIANGDIDKAKELRQIYSMVSGAETQEELDNALSQFEQIENKNYYATELEDIGATTGIGSKEKPYVYTDKKLADLKDLVEDGTLQVGDWVQYTNSSGKVILRQVNENGKLRNREDKGYPEGSYNKPIHANSVEEIENMAKNGTAKEGQYYFIKDYTLLGTDFGNFYKIVDGKVKKVSS